MEREYTFFYRKCNNGNRGFEIFIMNINYKILFSRSLFNGESLVKKKNPFDRKNMLSVFDCLNVLLLASFNAENRLEFFA